MQLDKRTIRQAVDFIPIHIHMAIGCPDQLVCRVIHKIPLRDGQMACRTVRPHSIQHIALRLERPTISSSGIPSPFKSRRQYVLGESGFPSLLTCSRTSSR